MVSIDFLRRRMSVSLPNNLNYLPELEDAIASAQSLYKLNNDRDAEKLLHHILTFKPTNPVLAAQCAKRAQLEVQAFDLLEQHKEDIHSPTRLVFLGDSHVYTFNYIGKNRLLLPYFFDCLIVGGATVQGLANPLSKTHAITRFNEHLFNHRKSHKALFFQLGEVDCGYLMWYRVQRHKESLTHQMNRSIQNYQALLTNARQQGWQNITLCSVPLPTIKEGYQVGDVATARSAISASRHDRTQLTLKFNQRLQALAQQEGYNFLDITEATLNHETGEVHDQFLNEDPGDHHLSYAQVAPLWVAVLRPFLQNL